MVKSGKAGGRGQVGYYLPPSDRPQNDLQSLDPSLVSHEIWTQLEALDYTNDLVPEAAPLYELGAFVADTAITSPFSHQSTGIASFDDSSEQSSIALSGSTGVLGRKRKLSPVFETPTSSVILGNDTRDSSDLAVRDGHGRRRRESLSQRSENADYQQRPRPAASRPITTLPTPSLNETLSYVGQPDTQVLHGQIGDVLDFQCVSIGDIHSTQAFLPTKATSPWNEYTLRQDPDVKKGGRKGPLSKDQAKHAKETRKRRACLKCHSHREKCEDMPGVRCHRCVANKEKCEGRTPETPCRNCEINDYECEATCRNCSVRPRTWVLGCIKLRLEDGVKLFVPDVLLKNLHHKTVYEFMNSNGKWKGEPFYLALTNGIGGRTRKAVCVSVREVYPRSGKLSDRSMHKAIDGDHVDDVRVRSAPLYAWYEDNPQGALHIVAQIERWLQDVEETKSNNWQWYCFEENEDLWERDVMEEICLYYHENEREHARQGLTQLKTALRLTVLVYLTVHPFQVPGAPGGELPPLPTDRRVSSNHIVACVAELYQRLGYPAHAAETDDEEVSPRAVNRFIVMLLVDKLRETANKALTDLNELLSSRVDDLITRELVFCTAFCCLMTVARFQTLIFWYSMYDPVLDEQAISPEEASQHIRKMEDSIASLIIELSVVKLRTKRGKVRPVEQDSLFDRIRSETERHGKRFNDPQKYELPPMDKDMAATNVRRLVCKLYRALQAHIE